MSGTHVQSGTHLKGCSPDAALLFAGGDASEHADDFSAVKTFTISIKATRRLTR